MSRYLMIDFGSTFTKLTAVDTECADIIATASHFTTVDTDITVGYKKALEQLSRKLGEDEPRFDKIIGCSSAAGGLKMAAIGLVEELTVEAARRVCLGAGAKVELAFSHHLTNSDIDKIIEKKIDIILLSGGTDGGNSECVLYNQRMLCERGIRSYDNYTRNVLDLAAVPVLHGLTHLPVVVDPSHATGVSRLVRPMACAACASGADGLIIEVHNDPAHALCDGAQSLTPAQFDEVASRVREIRSIMH